ncbi:MAG: type II toxin-antitoxin system death-on-curing family toxin [Verrucomicrobiota bacterium JB024]|nr:type II toxin-antitoxin system death-on-curing family toxin [Verrucomicrobiota bacterium JB024]
MNEPVFLTTDLVEIFHRRALELFGGMDGLRDRSALDGAVTQALNVYWYEQGDLFDIAGAFCFHIAQAQAFLDGNKRTAVVAALAFLRLNGVDTCPELTRPLHQAMLDVAKHRLDRIGLAALLRQLLG